jgi:transcriptional regulator with XRE-family HTH domain
LSLAERVIRYRKRKGWSPKELSDAAQVPPSRISEIEAGKNKWPTAETIRRLARALDVSMEQLWGGEEYEERAPAGESEIGVLISPDGSTDSQ